MIEKESKVQQLRYDVTDVNKDWSHKGKDKDFAYSLQGLTQ